MEIATFIRVERVGAPQYAPDVFRWSPDQARRDSANELKISMHSPSCGGVLIKRLQQGAVRGNFNVSVQDWGIILAESGWCSGNLSRVYRMFYWMIKGDKWAKK
jgi:hypothetical protein